MEAQKATNLSSSIPREETEEYQPTEHLPSSVHDNVNRDDHDLLQELNCLLPTSLQIDDMDEDLILDRTIEYIKFLMSGQTHEQMKEKARVMERALNTLNKQILKAFLTIELYKILNAEEEIKSVHRRKRHRKH